MEKWETFLKEVGKTKQIFLIGPMAGQSFNPLGPTIYIDGGANFFDGSEEHLHPTVTIGDNDSFKGKLDVVLPTKKDYSDLAWALRRIPKTVRHVEMIGFLGGRRDHELLNFGEVHHFLKTREKLTTVRFEDQVVAFTGGHVNLTINSEFSVMTFEQSLITIKGNCKYPIENTNMLLPVSSEGLSNVGRGLVTIDCLNPCFVFIAT